MSDISILQTIKAARMVKSVTKSHEKSVIKVGCDKSRDGCYQGRFRQTEKKNKNVKVVVTIS